jgi:hypothetical protein
MHTHALTHACTHMHRKGRSHAHTRTGTCMHTHAQTQKPVRMRTQRPAHTHGRPASAPRIWAPRFSAASASTLDHVNCPPYNLGAKIHGAETCYLGAMVHGAELGVYFLKSFQKGCTYENLSTKGLKNKKVGRRAARCSYACPGRGVSHAHWPHTHHQIDTAAARCTAEQQRPPARLTCHRYLSISYRGPRPPAVSVMSIVFGCLVCAPAPLPCCRRLVRSRVCPASAACNKRPRSRSKSSSTRD